jgi:sugar phosphate permease
MVWPDLIERGYTNADLGVAFYAISNSYGTSKLVIGGYLAVAMLNCSFL